MKKRILSITTGDSNGIGLEVTLKALHKLENSKSFYLIFRDKNNRKKIWKPLPKKLTFTTESLDDALTELSSNKSPYRFCEVLSIESPAHWVKASAQLCLNQSISGMVTGPVSKKTFIDANLDCIGHTPLLSKICQSSNVYMGFLGHSFNVLLITGHIPLGQVESNVNINTLKEALPVIHHWILKNMPTSISRRPIGVLGLNPHNGENGLIGGYEGTILEKAIKDHKKFRGPLVPDVAFLRENWKKYSFFIALYHDQGLIPFKMIHGRSGGCHVSVGLPIIRTSVDHGTAYDIFAKGCAKPESMIAAIKWCNILIKRKETFNGL